MRLRPAFRATIVVALVIAIVASCSGSSGSPTVSDAWVRPGASGADTAAYLVITGGNAADALVSASSPGAAMVELHETSTDDPGMTGMHPVGSLAIPAGASIALEPGGHHLMIMGLKQPLAVGDTLELDLVFEEAGKVVVQAEVKAG